MAHTRLVPQTYEKSDKTHDYNTISKKFATTPGLTDRLTTQDIINASLRKSTSQKYSTYQTRWKELCREKHN